MKVLLIEDEAMAARKLTRLLEQDHRIDRIVAHVDSVESALAWLESNGLPDLFFSDIELGDGLSFEIFRSLPHCPPIVFTTAYDQYALEAFRFPGMDYLLKPVSAEDLDRALSKLIALRAKGNEGAVEQSQLRRAFESIGAENMPARRFLVRMGEKLKALPVQEAAYYYVEDRVVFYQSKEGKRYPLDHSLEEVEHMLDDRHFFRINRQFIVRDGSIEDMTVVSKSRVKLNLVPAYHGDTIVSKERSPVFRRWIQGHMEA